MGFLSPWFLAGLAGLSVPVFIHLLRRYRTPPRPFSSLMFFERGTQSSTRHRRLRYLLLFALRAALVCLLAIAFANPFLRSARAGASDQRLLIVVDNSFSMRAGSRLADAKRQALAVLAAKPHAEPAQVLAFGSRLNALTEMVTDQGALRKAVEQIQPGDERGNFGEMARGVRALTESMHMPIELDLFSDMQKTGMAANFSDMAMPPNITLMLHSIGRSSANGTPNWAVEGLQAPFQLAGAKELNKSPVRAIVAGYQTPAAARTVSLLVNGKIVATRQVRVPANGRVAVEFPALDVPYGFSRCAVKIDSADSLPADDQSLFTVKRADPERVLFVHQGADSRSPLYFGAALAAADQAAYVLQPVTPEQTADIDPTKYAFVVLSDAGALPSIFENALLRYVRGGGGVLIAAGLASAHHTALPLWGGSISGAHDYSRDAGFLTVGRVDLSDPVMGGEAGQGAGNSGTQGGDASGQGGGQGVGQENAAWSDVKVYYATEVDPSDARAVATLADGTPLLLDKRIGEGRVLLLTSGLDNLTNDLPLHPIFVATVDRAAHYLSGSDRLNGSRTVGSFIQLRAAATGSAAQTASAQTTGVEVIDPDGRRPLSLSEAKSIQSYQFERAGYYQVRFANGGEALIGVNPDQRESDLAPMAQDDLKLWSAGLSQPGPSSAATTGEEGKQGKNVPHSIWWYVMLLALAVAAAESILASRYLGTLREES